MAISELGQKRTIIASIFSYEFFAMNLIGMRRNRAKLLVSQVMRTAHPPLNR
jgi:hypothetical protein